MRSPRGKVGPADRAEMCLTRPAEDKASVIPVRAIQVPAIHVPASQRARRLAAAVTDRSPEIDQCTPLACLYPAAEQTSREDTIEAAVSDA